MHAPDHHNPPPIYSNSHPEIGLEKSGLKNPFDAVAPRVVKDPDSPRNDKSTPPPVAPSITSPPSAILSRQADVRHGALMYLGDVSYGSAPTFRPRTLAATGEQNGGSKNTMEASNTQLRAEALQILEQMREYTQQLGGNPSDEIAQALSRCELRLNAIADSSPVLKGFVTAKKASFLEPVQRNINVRFQILKKRQKELIKSFKSPNLRGKQHAAAIEELRRIEAELGSDETDRAELKARHAHGLENLSVQKRLKTVKRLMIETRKRLAPYTLVDIEKRKRFGKQKDELQRKVGIKRAMQMNDEEKRDTARSRKEKWEEGFVLSPAELKMVVADDREKEEDSFVDNFIDDVYSELDHVMDLEAYYKAEVKVGPTDYNAENRSKYDGVIAEYERAEREKDIQRLLEQDDPPPNLERIIRRIERDAGNTFTDIQQTLEGRRQG